MKYFNTCLGAVLVLLLAVPMVLAGETTADRPNTDTAGTDTAAVAAPDSTVSPRVVAYYFYTTKRCASCRKIEAWSAEAINTGFADELENGSLEFRALNIDEEDNKHFIDDYKLYTKSLIVTKRADGSETEWKNLQKVWELLGNQDEFVQYVQDEVAAYLEAD